ncbi:MAG TPA: GreA/GreB family elongation factor [Polyangia bacterium]|nr:GreA/GreB family elongation factor [Polyangia bacterium]
MSKAFTKEDGPAEVPVLRRRAPLPAGVPNYVTPRGLQALRDELAALDPAARAEVTGAAAQERAARRVDLEQRIAGAVVAAPPADRAEIRFGARVRIATAGAEVREVHIVGVDEAEPAAHAIAFIAPLARALLGRRVGDTVSVRTPGGEEELTVLAVAYGDP